ncbi:hypothetical protein EJ04DRAFT_569363 [Polyplosphaeria fusca]|uniref:Uncharacterized protein n=1 Tax=Polyplosphaeria fusca TaxID=682080 RepID=A0A9P4QLE2_9PLEO|nr:hypothetical protein EJ04DRAFT_569363 [Polyplosphaeria fusca]
MSGNPNLHQKEVNEGRPPVVKEAGDGVEPPPYSSRSQASSITNVPPSVASTAINPSFDRLNFRPSPLELPTPAECITHLKLLHAFAKLRHEVGNREGVFGIDLGLEKFEDTKTGANSNEASTRRNQGEQPPGVHGQGPTAAYAGSGNEEQKMAALAERVREKRWNVYVAKAVDRFHKWWASLPSTSAQFPVPITTLDFDNSENSERIHNFTLKGSGMEDDLLATFPPLDVLMVWHTYMLNPRVYLEDCIRLTKHRIWKTAFPWEAVHKFINNETFEYEVFEGIRDVWEKSSALNWDLLDDGIQKTIQCPRCTVEFTVPWTSMPSDRSIASLEWYLNCDTGFVGDEFRCDCPQCELAITHEKLRVGKFISDASTLLTNKTPLPGTILDSIGTPQMTLRGKKKIGTHDPFFPNRAVENISLLRPDELRKNVDEITMRTLKSVFQSVLTSRSKVELVNKEQFKPELVAKESKIAVRKTLSHYWDNSSSFGLDLIGAVMRQGSFVQKMVKIDWLHSPAAMTTMERLIVKYHRFVRLIAENHRKTAVPTLDIDLAWHTHQLTPRIYYRYTLSLTRKFLNHDDKIPETSLHTNFQWTATAYEKKYSSPYSECACWYCECTREPLRSSLSTRLNPFSSSNPTTSLDTNLPRDPATGPHVSSHNAVTGTRLFVPYAGPLDSPAQRRNTLDALDRQYADVRKRYRKKKREADTPRRDADAYAYSPYGYPMYYPPTYVPYYSDGVGCEERFTDGWRLREGGLKAG